MTPPRDATPFSRSRRGFLKRSSTLLAAAAVAPRMLAAEDPKPPETLAFKQEGEGFAFDTGKLKGLLHAEGESVGLRPLIDVPSGKTLSRSMGIFSPYRLLAKDRRYGNAAWSWRSTGTLQPDGTVRIKWTADEKHPFDLEAIYRWVDLDTLDVTLRATAKQALGGFESFLASYFDGFSDSWVHAGETDKPAERPFLQATKPTGIWQMFPRNEKAETLILDGRWTKPPHPVDWTLRAKLHAPVALRRDAETGLTALVMAPPKDCFAIATPYGAEPHRSLYLSLMGDDLQEGQSATARARLVVARDLTFEQALQRYEAYLRKE
jgi:hypothetical protein